MIPVGHEDLRVLLRRATARPRELLSVRREHRQAVEAIRVSHAHRLARALGVDEEQLEVREAQLVRREDDVAARRMKIRCPRHRAEVREPPHVRAVELHRVHVGGVALLAEAPPDDALPVRREERPAVVARCARESAHIRAVGVHQINVAEVGGVHLHALAVLGREFVQRERVAHGAERDEFAVGRIAALGVVAWRVGEPPHVRAIALSDKQLHAIIVIPRVAARLAARAEVEFRLLLRLRLRVHVRAGEEHVVAAGA